MMTRTRFPDLATALAVLAAILLPFLSPSRALATEVLILAIAVSGSNLLFGVTGLLSFGQGVFFGLGAYTCGLALLSGGLGLWSSLGLSALVGAGGAALVGALSIRRRGVYFVVLTLAFAQMAVFLMLMFKAQTGGENGIIGIPRPPFHLFGTIISPLDTSLSFYVFAAVVFLVCFLLLQRVIASPFGSVLLAIRESESRALALGYDTYRYKLLAFIFSGLVSGIAGALYTMALGFVSPATIDLEMSERIVVMNIIGGTGSMFGPVLGAAFYSIMSESLSSLWPRWLLLIGFLMIAIVLFMRGGLWGGLESLVTRVIAARRRP